jgi:hypothetical protein
MGGRGCALFQRCTLWPATNIESSRDLVYERYAYLAVYTRAQNGRRYSTVEGVGNRSIS